MFRWSAYRIRFRRMRERVLEAAPETVRDTLGTVGGSTAPIRTFPSPTRNEDRVRAAPTALFSKPVWEMARHTNCSSAWYAHRLERSSLCGASATAQPRSGFSGGGIARPGNECQHRPLQRRASAAVLARAGRCAGLPGSGLARAREFSLVP